MNLDNAYSKSQFDLYLVSTRWTFEMPSLFVVSHYQDIFFEPVPTIPLMLPQTADHLKALERKNVIEIYPDKPRGIRVVEEKNEFEIPLIGSVAAGVPIEAIENVESFITIPEVLQRKKPTFLLRVRGDSMIDAGILDGDLIAVRKTQTANVGQIVVARIEDEVTVKRLEMQGANAVLQPANDFYEPIILPAEDLAIEGLFVGLIRA